jgi:hypothetical protein
MLNKGAARGLRHPYPIFILALLVMTGAIWIYLWTGLASYEAGIPRNLMEQTVRELVDEAREEGTCAGVLESAQTNSSKETLTRDGAILAELILDKEITYRKIVGWEGPGSLAYHILADGEEVAVATLTEAAQKGVLGLARYEIAGLQGTLDLSVMAAPEVQVFAGDVPLTREHLSDQDRIPTDLQKLADSGQAQVKIPRYDVYGLKGLFKVPAVRGVDGQDRFVEGVFVAPDCAVVGLPMDPVLLEEVAARAVTITQKYSYYMSDDLGWSGFKGYLMDNAPIYDRLRTLEVNWYTLHDSSRFENMKTLDWILYSDRLISLRMTYDYVVVGQGKVTTYDTDLTYYLALAPDGKWRVAEMIVN